MASSIEHIYFDFRTEHEKFARSLCAQWESFYPSCVERPLEEVLGLKSREGCRLVIDRLELNLGEIPEKDFLRYFPVRLRESFEGVLRPYLLGKVPNARVFPASDHALELIREFLLRGTITATHLSAYGGTVRSLFRYAIRNHGDALAGFLRSYGHYTGLQERLVHQLDDPALEQGVSLLQPGNGEFIVGYVRTLHRKYRLLEQPVIPSAGYRYAVWQVVYSYLLNTRGSVFNRKNFLTVTISDLAGQLRTTFIVLVRMLAGEIVQWRERYAARLPELLILLDEIRRDTERRERERLGLDTGKLYRMLAQQIRERRLLPDSQWLPLLINTLGQESSSMLVLQLLTEKQIRSIVPVILPRQNEFILDYADALERGQRYGLQSGKAGGDFTRIKWVVIFRVLLENRGAGFNRIYFVEQVIAKLAARYNLGIYELLDSLTHIQHLERIDKNLSDIFCRLKNKYNVRPSIKIPGRTHAEPSGEWILRPELLSALDRVNLKNLFSREDFRRTWLDNHTEKEYRKLLTAIYPEQSALLSDYAARLDRTGKNYALEGRSGRSFSRIKWEFILQVLTVRYSDSFNWKFFVKQTLTAIAAHYNLTFFELLLYLSQEKDSFPVTLKETLTGLLEQEISGGVTHQTGRVLPDAVWRLFPARQRRELELFRKSVRDYINRINSEDGSYKFIACQIERLWEEWLVRYLISGTRQIPVTDFFGQVIRRLAAITGTTEEKINRFINSGGDRNLRTVTDHRQKTDEKNPQYERVPSPDDRKGLRTPISNDMERNKENRPEVTADFFSPASQKSYEQSEVPNAGLVLLSPYLPRLFRMLDLIDIDDFRGDTARVSAVFLLQYAVYGEQGTEYPEYELALNKLLTNFPPGKSLPVRYELTGEQCRTVDSMLCGALQNWDKLKNTSPKTFRQAFLQRQGILEEQNLSEQYYTLTVEERPYDILLDSLPWNFRLLQYTWTSKPLKVSWR